jgi:RimJ/RimL family protein N-acetyltransferase
MEEVPGSEEPLLALDEQPALTGQNEERLLIRLGVVDAALAGLEHGHIDPELRELDRRLTVLVAEPTRRTPRLGGEPLSIAHVDDEPALGDGGKPGASVLKPRFVQNRILAGQATHPSPGPVFWERPPERPAILASVQADYGGGRVQSERGGIVLRTGRLSLLPLTGLDEAEHARASRNAEDALRDTRAAEPQWQEHGFGPWAIRDTRDGSFLGCAELRFAGEGIEGIAADDVEAGWWVTEERRNEGIATEAMEAAIDDLWSRTDVQTITAYIEDGQNEPSRRVAAKLGFAVRSTGRGRSGEPMTVYTLCRDDWRRRL